MVVSFRPEAAVAIQYEYFKSQTVTNNNQKHKTKLKQSNCSRLRSKNNAFKMKS